ncbi:bacteriohemerythrin [Geoglobus acetivorans]|uniref:Bacteriohemerythrin n=1 Tax=Geoglobus acetivorans TaxID=565033 RepID=A0ABZ3H4S9_GEOAI|nr:bacteriohemerythrin [Geoglobus acetivorans]
MALITWNESFSVNIREIDEQHKKLVSMINRLHDAMLEGKGKEIMGELLNDMVEYTITHFSTEEKLMKQHNYPGYVKHKAEHELFVSKVGEFKEKYEKGQLALTMEVLSFLKSWLTNHILNSDKKYGPFFNNKGIY